MGEQSLRLNPPPFNGDDQDGHFLTSTTLYHINKTMQYK